MWSNDDGFEPFEHGAARGVAPAVLHGDVVERRQIGILAVGDHHHLRAGRDVLVELGEHGAQPLVDAEHERALRTELRHGAQRELRAVGDTRLSEPDRAVVLRDQDELVTRLDDGGCRGVDLHRAAMVDADHRAVVEVQLRLHVRLADQRGLLAEVDLVAVEVEQLGVDEREAGLAAGLHGDATDEVGAEHPARFILADQFGRLHVGVVTDLADHVVLALLAARVVGDRERRLDDVDVGVVGALWSEHDDAASAVRVDQVEVDEVHGIARPAHDLRVLGVGHLRADGVLHLDLVLVGEDDDDCALARLVRDHELAHDLEHLGAPAEDERVVALEHARAALAQFLHLRVERAGHDADEARHDDQTADRDDEHQDAEEPALVAAHRSRVEGAHEAAPEDVPHGFGDCPAGWSCPG